MLEEEMFREIVEGLLHDQHILCIEADITNLLCHRKAVVHQESHQGQEELPPYQQLVPNKSSA
jgi:hypothetical protein